MTQLIRTVRRKTAARYKQRALVVTLHPRHIDIREERRRDTVSVDYETLYEFAMKLRFRRQQAEQRSQKQQRRAK